MDPPPDFTEKCLSVKALFTVGLDKSQVYSALAASKITTWTSPDNEYGLVRLNECLHAVMARYPQVNSERNHVVYSTDIVDDDGSLQAHGSLNDILALNSQYVSGLVKRSRLGHEILTVTLHFEGGRTSSPPSQRSSPPSWIQEASSGGQFSDQTVTSNLPSSPPMACRARRFATQPTVTKAPPKAIKYMQELRDLTAPDSVAEELRSFDSLFEDIKPSSQAEPRQLFKAKINLDPSELGLGKERRSPPERQPTLMHSDQPSRDIHSDQSSARGMQSERQPPQRDMPPLEMEPALMKQILTEPPKLACLAPKEPVETAEKETKLQRRLCMIDKRLIDSINRGAVPEYCRNCGTVRTYCWRRLFVNGAELVLCNACGLYYKSKKKMRPQELFKDRVFEEAVDDPSNQDPPLARDQPNIRKAYKAALESVSKYERTVSAQTPCQPSDGSALAAFKRIPTSVSQRVQTPSPNFGVSPLFESQTPGPEEHTPLDRDCKTPPPQYLPLQEVQPNAAHKPEVHDPKKDVAITEGLDRQLPSLATDSSIAEPSSRDLVFSTPKRRPPALTGDSSSPRRWMSLYIHADKEGDLFDNILSTPCKQTQTTEFNQRVQQLHLEMAASALPSSPPTTYCHTEESSGWKVLVSPTPPRKRTRVASE